MNLLTIDKFVCKIHCCCALKRDLMSLIGSIVWNISTETYTRYLCFITSCNTDPFLQIYATCVVFILARIMKLYMCSIELRLPLKFRLVTTISFTTPFIRNFVWLVFDMYEFLFGWSRGQGTTVHSVARRCWPSARPLQCETQRDKRWLSNYNLESTTKYLLLYIYIY